MFNNIFQSLKEIGNPRVQDGQPIVNQDEVGTEKPVVLDEDGELTEEGFVAVGGSSFYSLNNETYSPPRTGSSRQQPLYPPIPSATANPNMPMPYGNHYQYGVPPTANNPGSGLPYHHAPLLSMPSIEMADTVRNILTLHPDLIPHVGISGAQFINRLSGISQEGTLDMNEFNYDFEFERGVLRDIGRQFN